MLKSAIYVTCGLKIKTGWIPDTNKRMKWIREYT